MSEEIEYEEVEAPQAISEETTPVAETTSEVAEMEPKKKTRRVRKPSLKDWVRVIKSQGNTLPNTTVHLIINKSTGLAELVTNAPALDGSSDLEGERTQVFAITSYEVIDEPDRDPLGEAETAAEAKAKADAKVARDQAKAAKAAEKPESSESSEVEVPAED